MQFTPWYYSMSHGLAICKNIRRDCMVRHNQVHAMCFNEVIPSKLQITYPYMVEKGEKGESHRNKSPPLRVTTKMREKEM